MVERAHTSERTARWSRLWKHSIASRVGLFTALPRAELPSIAQAITDAESRQGAEIRIVIDVRLSVRDIMRRIDAREAAIEHFAQLRMWDSEQRNGVLLYLLWAEHRIEVIADRSAVAAVPEQEWSLLCRGMEDEIHRAGLKEALLFGVQKLSDLLAPHFAPISPSERRWSDEIIIC